MSTSSYKLNIFFGKKRLVCCIAVLTLILFLISCPTDGGFAVTGVALSEPTLEMTVGDQITLTFQIIPYNADIILVSWRSSNSDIVAVTAAGLLTAVSAGEALVTVKTLDGGFTATCVVTVAAAPADVPVSGVTVDESAASLVVGGDTLSLTATVVPADATNKTVSWSSSQSGIATVSGGVVTAVAPGVTEITVTTDDGGQTASCTVTVTAAVPDFELAGDWYWFSARLGGYVHSVVTNSPFYHYTSDGSQIEEGTLIEYDNTTRTGLFSFETSPGNMVYRRIQWNERAADIYDITQYEVVDNLEEARTTMAVGEDEALIMYMTGSLVPPVILLEGDDPLAASSGVLFTDPGARVYDWGVDPVSIQASSLDGLDPADPAAGTYTLTYSYTIPDAEGNTAVPVTRTVEVGSGLVITVQ